MRDPVPDESAECSVCGRSFPSVYWFDKHRDEQSDGTTICVDVTIPIVDVPPTKPYRPRINKPRHPDAIRLIFSE